ncbi:MAG: transposase [Actinomycetota bacterium]|nr:transposase [Actinomycetota bacterium]
MEAEMRAHLGAAKACFPSARYQRCKVHFMQNVFSKVPRRESADVALMLKAIFAQESREAALSKAKEAADKLRSCRLTKAAEVVENGIEANHNLLFVSAPPRALYRKQQFNGASQP